MGLHRRSQRLLLRYVLVIIACGAVVLLAERSPVYGQLPTPPPPARLFAQETVPAGETVVFQLWRTGTPEQNGTWLVVTMENRSSFPAEATLLTTAGDPWGALSIVGPAGTRVTVATKQPDSTGRRRCGSINGADQYLGNILSCLVSSGAIVAFEIDESMPATTP